MSVKNGQLVRLYDSSSIAVENLVSGSSVAGVQLSGLGLNESDWKTWASTDISSTSLTLASVRKAYTFPNTYDTLEINGGSIIVWLYQKILIKDGNGTYKFIYANDISVNTDSLIKFEDGVITEELITSVYTLQNQTITTIDIEDVDVYLLNN